MTAIREMRKWEAISPVIRGRSRSRSRILRRVGSARARHSGAVRASRRPRGGVEGRIHVTSALHNQLDSRKRGGARLMAEPAASEILPQSFTAMIDPDSYHRSVHRSRETA